MNLGVLRARTVACALLLLAPLGVASAPSAAAAPGAVPTSVTTRLADTAHIGTTRPLTVHLSADDGQTPLPDQPVVAQRRVDGSWTDIFRARTDATGTLTQDVLIRAGDNVFRVRYAGDATYAPDTSAVERVAATRIGTRLTLAAPDRVRDGASVVLRISWLARDGRPVTRGVDLQRRTARSDPWRSSRDVRVRSGTARVDVRPRADTSYRVVGAGGTWYTGDRSGGQRVDNIPPARPVQMPRNAPRPRVDTPPQPRALQAGLAPTVGRIPNDVWRRMTGISWHRGCPVGRAGLRLVQLNYYGFDGYRHRGQIVIARYLADNVVRIFRDLYQGQYPVRRMYLPDRFGYSRRLGGANDYRSMAADNTSGFNCRHVVNKPSARSPHSYGTSIDLNPWENPYRSRTGLVPNSWWDSATSPYRVVYRSSTHPVVQAFARQGFRWLGASDWQHFQD